MKRQQKHLTHHRGICGAPTKTTIKLCPLTKTISPTSVFCRLAAVGTNKRPDLHCRRSFVKFSAALSVSPSVKSLPDPICGRSCFRCCGCCCCCWWWWWITVMCPSLPLLMPLLLAVPHYCRPQSLPSLPPCFHFTARLLWSFSSSLPPYHLALPFI